ncbi:MAG: hypothetical protein NTY05_00540 [Rhodocyclales bacterium]|nr:hypothetical protein [Rhodocyclales bacterium]
MDYGSGLGHYYLITKAVLPNVSIDYHCKEMPALVAAGRQIVPNATWHSDDTCLDRGYDLVILSGVLQCMKDWESQLRAIGAVANEWLFVTRTPIVESAKTYAAVLHTYGSAMLHWQFNRAQLLSFVKSLGFAIEREFDIGDRHQVKDGPEPFELRGWLFKRVNT